VPQAALRVDCASDDTFRSFGAHAVWRELVSRQGYLTVLIRT
jgi:hypothetical protein